jgi:hypothetical protein
MDQTAAQADSLPADAADSSWDEAEQRQFLLGLLLFKQDFETISQLMLPGRAVSKQHVSTHQWSGWPAGQAA